jgi:hypothetical protein
MNELIKHAFVEELDKIAATEELTELQKEAIFGVKALMMGARRLGSGIAGKAKAGLIKAQVGVNKAQLGATKGIQKAVAGPSRTGGGQFKSPSKLKQWVRGKTSKDVTKLESSIASGTARGNQTSQIAGQKIKGTGTAVKRTYGVEKQDTRAWIDNIKRKKKINKKVKLHRDTKAVDAAGKAAPKPINTNPKITSAPKPKVDPKKVTPKKKDEGVLNWVGANIVGKDSKNKTLAGGAALLGGGYMASNMMNSATKKPAEQGIFFKSSSLDKTASLGGTTLGTLTKYALKGQVMKAIKKVTMPFGERKILSGALGQGARAFPAGAAGGLAAIGAAPIITKVIPATASMAAAPFIQAGAIGATIVALSHRTRKANKLVKKWKAGGKLTAKEHKYVSSNVRGGNVAAPVAKDVVKHYGRRYKKPALYTGVGAGVGAGAESYFNKEANPKMKALKMIGGGATVGAGAGYLANDAFEPDGNARMKLEAQDAFKATFPDLPGPDADNMFEQVWSKYKKNQQIQLSKAVIQGASDAQKFGSFTDELKKEASIAAIGKIVAKIGYGAGRALAGGKHLGNLAKAKKLTNLQRVGMSAMKNRKVVGTGIVAAGGGYALGRRKK